MTININELRRKANSTDVEDHIYLHANIRPLLSELIDRIEAKGGDPAMQDALMKFDPATGEERPYPSHATQWRNWHGNAAWLFDPWTGKRRNAYDVGSDVHGLLIAPAGTLGMDMGGGCATTVPAQKENDDVATD